MRRISKLQNWERARWVSIMSAIQLGAENFPNGTFTIPELRQVLSGAAPVVFRFSNVFFFSNNWLLESDRKKIFVPQKTFIVSRHGNY